LAQAPPTPRARRFPVFLDAPSWTMNRLTLAAFNAFYYHRQRARLRRAVVHFDPFFYPLDAVDGWNRLYGRPGLFQFQCVVPFAGGHVTIREMLTEIARSRQSSFVAVLKSFGELRSPGWLSFPRPGFTLAIDFANRGDRTRELLDRLDAIVVASGGAEYPAKDARMPASVFSHSFPDWERITPYVDPRFSSSFWRRVTGNEPPTRMRNDG
jgi:hypothetical protein